MNPRVLILCTGNSARSQMAEGLLRSLGGGRVEVHSAGTNPGTVRREAIAVMAELGIDISGHRAKHVREFDGQRVDYVITVCDHASENCPVFPAGTVRIHWSFPDPAAVDGDEPTRLTAFREVRDALAATLRGFVGESLPATDPVGNRLTVFEPAPATVEAWPGGGSALSPGGSTALWVAASRALESESAEPLYCDPYARALAGDTGFAILRTMRAAMGLPENTGTNPYLTIRTRYFDDALVAAVRAGSLTQVVILAAGLDARAFRLDWPSGVGLFEVDRDDIFAYKEPLLSRAGARPRCDRRIVRADLSAPWTGALTVAGFDPGRPAAFLAEGLLVYLEEAAAAALIESIRKIAAAGSWLGLDLANTAMLTSPVTAASVSKLAAAGCPWRFGVDDAESFLGQHGWTATVASPGDPDVSHGRWPFPSMSRREPGIPANYFVQAR